MKLSLTKMSATTLVLVIAIVLSGVVSLTRFNIGNVHISALLTIFCSSSAWLLWLIRPVLTRAVATTIWPFVLFLVWAFLSFAWNTNPTVTGVQNLLVVSAFVGFIFLASYESYLKPTYWRLVGGALKLATSIVVGLYVFSIIRFGLGTAVGSDVTDAGPRTVALFVLLGLAWYLASWRYSSRQGFWWAVAITVMIGASLSRGGLVAAAILFPMARISLKSLRGWVRLVIHVALVSGLFYLAVTYIEPINDRFFEGDQALNIGGTTVNASGRVDVWQITLNSALESPWIGKGAGAAGDMLRESTGSPAIEHPHNDYLRMLHDFGLIGLGLWVLGLIKLLRAVYRSWTMADSRGDPAATLHLATLLAIVGATIAMITDNSLVYIFVMAPLGALVGVSLGRSSAKRPPLMQEENISDKEARVNPQILT